MQTPSCTYSIINHLYYIVIFFFINWHYYTKPFRCFCATFRRVLIVPLKVLISSENHTFFELFSRSFFSLVQNFSKLFPLPAATDTGRAAARPVRGSRGGNSRPCRSKTYSFSSFLRCASRPQALTPKPTAPAAARMPIPSRLVKSPVLGLSSWVLTTVKW